MHSGDSEVPLGNGACLIESNRFDPGESLKIVGALYKDPLVAGSAESCKETEWYAYDQSTWAADYQESACTEYPVAPNGTYGLITAHSDTCDE